MTEALWTESAPPRLDEAWPTLVSTTIIRPADLTTSRAQLTTALALGALPADQDDEGVAHLLLTFEELASNGLRHGRQPVEVTVTATGACWLVLVTDSDDQQPPTPAVDRDPAEGGLGLFLVARMAVAHGWRAELGRKEVWACVRRTAIA